MAKHDMTMPQFYMLSTSKVLAQDLRNGHLAAEECAPMVQGGQVRQQYPSALTEEPWAIGAPRLPPAKGRPRGGRPRKGPRREVRPTLFALHHRGCPGALGPHARRPQRTV